MELSVVQTTKLAIVSITGLSKDALHIYVGLMVYLVTLFVLRSYKHKFFPILIVVMVACLGELLDMRDDIRSLGHWRWGASLHDVVNTSFWPLVLYLLMKKTSLFNRNS